MSAADAAAKVRQAMETLRQGVADRPLVEILDLSHEMAEAMQAFFGSLDRSIISEFRYIGDFIRKARDEIAELQPNEIHQQRIPGASIELDAVVRDTEQATETIMSEAESLMMESGDDPDYKDKVDAAMMKIIEACSFQDLTGQRVRKVTSTLRHIEERVSQFADALGVRDAVREETPAQRRAREQLINGPALNGPEVAQSDIDAMFSEGAEAFAEVSQDDIDALFA